MGPRGVCLIAGPLIMFIGGLPLVFVVGFSSMVRPEIQGWELFWVIIERMFNFNSDVGPITVCSGSVFLLGFGLFFWGMILVSKDLFRFLIYGSEKPDGDNKGTTLGP
jgi:hypothetical protein